MKLRLLISAAALAALTATAYAAGVDMTAIDKSVVPGDDFYSYANGNWIKRTEIPADQSRWGSSIFSIWKPRPAPAG